ncbi:MAG TPA: right-handed parallel beta-helix repeat-containing protein, partial [Chitinophagaceae bacterium]|nr:right-handed parallel beta-helix repeat-containing protein [Chitinophagaceae bacterium]
MTKTLLYGLSALAVFSSCSKELEEQSTALEIASLQTGLTTTATVSLPAPKDLTKVFIAFKDTSAYFWNPVTRLWVPEIADYSTTGSIPFSASQLAVPTPEALRNRIGVDSGELVRTKGYYSDNDGGATDYHWSPNSREADDGGSVLRPLTITASKAGRWKALFAGKRVSVKQFGAKADYNGSAGTPIRPFVDKAVAYAAGKMTIYFPSGKYYTTSEIKVSGVRNLVLEGQPGATIYKAREGVFDGTECIFKVKDCEGARISGFSLYGHTPGLQYIKDKWGNITPLINAGDGGIYVYDSRDVEIFRNNFYNFGDGAIRAATLILVNGSVATRRVNVHDNFFRNIFQLSTTYTTGSACADYTLQNNVFDSVKGSIKFASRTTGASNIVIRNNTVRNAFHIGFEFANVSNVQLIGNKLEAPDTCASTPVGVVVYPNIISSGTLVHGNMNHFTIRDGYFRGFRKGIRVKNEQVNGVMYNM